MKHSHLRLGLFLFLPGHHIAGWRLPGANAGGSVDLAAYRQAAAACEAAHLDMLFIGDTLAMPHMPEQSLARSSRAEAIDPLLVLSALAAVTKHIGLVATATTSYLGPFYVARQFASLDHLSQGRAGWNLVTSSNQREAANFGASVHLDHADRYRRAEEFLDVVKRLWDGWEGDAVVADKEGGIFLDPTKIHALDHRGEHFTVSGPLPLRRSPQGHPVIVQAGSSEDGMTLGAKAADVIFTAHPDKARAQAFYADMKARAVSAGRSPSDIVIMPGVMPIFGRTREEADALEAELSANVDDALAVGLLSEMAGGIDFSSYDLDAPFPQDLTSNAGKSRLELLKAVARREGLSLRQIGHRVALGRGHLVLKGTPEDVGKTLVEWFQDEAADGFNIMAPVFDDAFYGRLGELTAYLSKVGVYRQRYEEKTLRYNLGLENR
jgi:FMN-dependent oxidoreductase (nitrilotriacetate monooxygenase family)